jgi:hypothetical protein
MVQENLHICIHEVVYFCCGPDFSPESTKLRFWPTAAINGSEFHAQTMPAFWPGPEPASIDGVLAAVDPKANLSPTDNYAMHFNMLNRNLTIGDIRKCQK